MKVKILKIPKQNQDEMHFHQDEQLKDVSRAEKRCSEEQGEDWTGWGRLMTRINHFVYPDLLNIVL